MAKVTLIFAGLLVALGLGGYLGTGSLHPTALIPMWIGMPLGLCGFLAISPNESRRKLFMHISVTIALLGLLGTVGEIIRSSVSVSREMSEASAATPVTNNGAQAVSVSVDFMIAMGSKITLAILLLIYVILCVRSFIAARRSGKV